MNLPDWINTDTVTTATQVTAALVSAVLVWTATRQLRAIDVERRDRWIPVVGFTARQTNRHGDIEVAAVNAGPATAIGLTAEMTAVHTSIELRTGTSIFAALLPMNESVKFDASTDGMYAYLQSQQNSLAELRAAELRAVYSDPLGHRYASTADLVFVNMVQATEAWQIRNIRPAVPNATERWS